MVRNRNRTSGFNLVVTPAQIKRPPNRLLQCPRSSKTNWHPFFWYNFKAIKFPDQRLILDTPL